MTWAALPSIEAPDVRATLQYLFPDLFVNRSSYSTPAKEITTARCDTHVTHAIAQLQSRWSVR